MDYQWIISGLSYIMIKENQWIISNINISLWYQYQYLLDLLVHRGLDSTSLDNGPKNLDTTDIDFKKLWNIMSIMIH